MYKLSIYFDNDKNPRFEFITKNKHSLDELYDNLLNTRGYIKISNFIFKKDGFSHAILSEEKNK